MADGGKSSVALVGLRGAGKTTVGRLLAGLVKLPFIDTDEAVEAEAGQSIRQIFETEGEAGFRARERRAIQAATSGGPAVIAVGGGAVEDPANVADLKAAAEVVWLMVSTREAYRRIKKDARSNDRRPPLTDETSWKEICKVLARRQPLYAAVSNWLEGTDFETPVEIARRIAQRMNEKAVGCE